MTATDNAATTPEEAAEAEARRAGIDRATGHATDGKWPVNNRLRAEAMSRAGVTSDPDGNITDELIADTAARLEREDAEAERAAREAPSLKWSRDKLAAEAERLGVPIETDANKAAILEAINAAPAATTTTEG